MKVTYKKRETEKKREAGRIRRSGGIPAVLYAQGKEAEHIVVEESEIAAVLRQVPEGRLSTTIIDLGTRKAIIKDIQYHPTTYKVLHMDLVELHPNVKINVKVPVECVGILDCVGIKQGGTLRRVLRSVKVNCSSKEIPPYFEVDVREMSLGQYKRVKDLNVPKGVKLLGNLEEVAVVIAKK